MADGCEREKVWRKEPLVTTMMDEAESKSGVFVLLSLWRLQNNLQHPVRIIHSLTLTPSVTDHRQTDRNGHQTSPPEVRYEFLPSRVTSALQFPGRPAIMIPVCEPSSGRREKAVKRSRTHYEAEVIYYREQKGISERAVDQNAAVKLGDEKASSNENAATIV